MDIISTPKGYILNNNESNENYIIRTIACRHSKDFIEDELNSIVDEGATVVNVIVEHSVYGQITGDLHVSSRRDVKAFINKLKLQDINPLAQLTDGIHLHTIKCRDEETYQEIIKSLKERDICIKWYLISLNTNIPYIMYKLRYNNWQVIDLVLNCNYRCKDTYNYS